MRYAAPVVSSYSSNVNNSKSIYGTNLGPQPLAAKNCPILRHRGKIWNCSSRGHFPNCNSPCLFAANRAIVVLKPDANAT
jgi:hypothetical protein